jgi:AbrB family looped-hinge helix DNA binding protein
MATASITSKGQITLPKEIREHLHITSGDRLEFVIDEAGEVRLRPLRGSVKKLFGLLHRPGLPALSIEDIDDEIGAWVAKDDERIRRGGA